MKIVGKLNRNEIELDPVKALACGESLDAAFPSTLPPHPRGVFRGTHEFFNRMDFERILSAARKLNCE